MIRKLLLFLPSIIMQGIIHLRHFLFDLGIFHSQKSPIKTIVIGNLSIGGAGKTPFADMMIHSIKDHKVLGFVSRGYGRKSKGPLPITNDSTAADIGDEPLLIHRHHPEMPGFVAEKRNIGIEKLLIQSPQIDCIVLDDAMQHRALQGNLNILISKFDQPFYNDSLWPMGHLRDLKCRAKKVQSIAITNCPPDLSEREKKSVLEQIQTITQAPVFFFHTEILHIQSLHKQSEIPNNWGAFCGIAHPDSFFESIQKKYNITEKVTYADHQWLGEKEAHFIRSKLVTFGGPIEGWLTTEKDAMRIAHLESWKDIPVFYLPIITKINEADKEAWKQWLTKNI
jgi:tetraacyldisaccharide 4'-kinase